MNRWIVPALVLLLAGCSSRRQSDFALWSEQFLHESLRLSPVSATASGYHMHKGVVLDELLPDYSAVGMKEQKEFFLKAKAKVAEWRKAELDLDSQADLELIETQIELALLEWDSIQNWSRNPTLYVETFGNGVFTPWSIAYASPENRYRHIIARMKALPAFVEQARANLKEAPPIWAQVALMENEGNIALLEKTIKAGVPHSLVAEYDQALQAALPALAKLSARIRALPDSGEESWRLPPDLYARKFGLALGQDLTPDKVLNDAELFLRDTRRSMFSLAMPLHHSSFPSHRHAVDLNVIVGEVLGRIAERHATPADYFASAQRTLDEARDFLKRGTVVPLPPKDNLKLIETPPFMRGIYAVGGFNPAPTLEPGMSAYYWLTPIPAEWPRERIESKLREYNEFGLRTLTLHEALPGHYLQYEYANQVQPASRRLLRSLLGSSVYVEGWAQYSTGSMLDNGFLNYSPELRLTYLKQQLRATANAILDVRIHTKSMTEGEAMDLMTTSTFQEQEEAKAKWQRARLDACQLPTYFVGYREWDQLLAKEKGRQGAGFSLPRFHELALRTGAVSMRMLRRLTAENVNAKSSQ